MEFLYSTQSSNKNDQFWNFLNFIFRNFSLEILTLIDYKTFNLITNQILKGITIHININTFMLSFPILILKFLLFLKQRNRRGSFDNLGTGSFLKKKFDFFSHLSQNETVFGGDFFYLILLILIHYHFKYLIVYKIRINLTVGLFAKDFELIFIKFHQEKLSIFLTKIYQNKNFLFQRINRF